MSTWYTRVCADLGQIPNFIAHYELELEQAKFDVSVKGNVEKMYLVCRTKFLEKKI